MKKRLMILATLLCMAVAVTGCSSKKTEDKANNEQATEETKTGEEDTQTQDDAAAEDPIAKIPVTDKKVADEGIDKFVKLGNYKGLKLEKTISTVTDAEVEDRIKQALSEKAEEIKEGTVQNGDIANIDYEGKKDGVAFDGGTSQGYELTIGSNSFIEGFETGLIGAKIGETKELKLTFPENYSEDLAGKDVVFTVKVNSIKRPATEATDEWVAANTDYKTVAEYKDSIKKELQANLDASSEQTLEGTAWQQVISAAEVTQLPKDEIDAAAASYKSQVEASAQQYGMDMKTFLENQSMTEEQFEEQCQQYGKNMAHQGLILQAIEEKEGFKKEDADYKAILDELIKTSGFESYDKVIESGVSAMDVHRTVMIRLVLKLVVDQAEITEVPEQTQAKGTPEVTE